MQSHTVTRNGKVCQCYIRDLPQLDQLELHYGAHDASCPAYRESLDPVDREHDERARKQYTENLNPWPVISAYSRAQAIEDGVLVDLMHDKMAEVARQHYKHPIACTAAVFEIMRKAAENKRHGNDYAGVLHDMLWMSRVYGRGQLGQSTVLFRVKITGAGRKNLYDFKLMIGPGDDATPMITIMLPEED